MNLYKLSRNPVVGTVILHLLCMLLLKHFVFTAEILTVKFSKRVVDFFYGDIQWQKIANLHYCSAQIYLEGRNAVMQKKKAM